VNHNLPHADECHLSGKPVSAVAALGVASPEPERYQRQLADLPPGGEARDAVLP
jgi:hypothetical protein